MAKEEDLKLDTPDNSAKPGKKKLLIIIIAVVLVLLIAGGAAAFFLLSGDKKAEDSGEPQAEAAAPAEVPIALTYHKLEPEFIVNFQVMGRQHFAQVGLIVVTKKQSVIDAIAVHNPMLRSEILRIIGEQGYEQLRTAMGKDELQKQLKEKLAALLKENANADGIDDVLYYNFILQ